LHFNAGKLGLPLGLTQEPLGFGEKEIYKTAQTKPKPKRKITIKSTNTSLAIK